MFGPSLGGWIGLADPVGASPSGGRLTAILVFQMLFCATATTIVTGAVAERLKFAVYLLIAALMALFLFPLFGHWAWHSRISSSDFGWLEKLGFIDWAGGTVVHSLAGWVALALILVVGPRINRFSGNSAERLDGYTVRNLPFAVLGTFILFVGWIGFNAGSTLKFEASIPGIVVNTLAAGAAGCLAATALGWHRGGKPGVVPCIMGLLAGLVSVTAGAHAVTPFGAVTIGGIAGLASVISLELLEKYRIDDVVGAIPVHLVGGVWGTLAVAIFATPDFLLANGRISQIAVQTVGIGACFVLGFVFVYPLLRLLNRLFPFRVSEADEKRGLGVSQHGNVSELDKLVEVMAKQSELGDLSLRAMENDSTELGKVGHFYNKLVDKQETLTHNLEAHVARRTRQLEIANADLKSEIERRENTQRALAEAKEEAEFANRTKFSFLANMSHELRTPLNSIIGFSDILNAEMYGKMPDDRYLDYANCINESGQHLLAIINDILDLSKIETAELVLREENLEVGEWVDRCINVVSQDSRHKKLDISSDIPANLPAIRADQLRLRQVLLNLLSNAIKFTPERGCVGVTATISGSRSLVVEVSDTGVGIPESDLEKVLTPFGQTEYIMTRQQEGTGLGLYISKSLIELHGGAIELKSVLNEGTTVSIEIPAERLLWDSSSAVF